MLQQIFAPKKFYQRVWQRIADNYRQRIMPRPRHIIVAGWEASGSTFVSQVAKLLGLNVQKIHGKWEQERLEFVIFTIRDPRDVICSHARRFYSEQWEAGKYKEALLKSLEDFIAARYIEDLFNSLAQPNVIIMRYETFIGHSEATLVRMLSDQFMISLDEQKLATILAETSIEANQKRAEKLAGFEEYDIESLIHGLHITNQGRFGAWKEWFTPAVDNAVKEKLGDALVQLGYENDTNWSSNSAKD
jgi:hypothetical protein